VWQGQVRGKEERGAGKVQRCGVGGEKQGVRTRRRTDEWWADAMGRVCETRIQDARGGRREKRAPHTSSLSKMSSLHRCRARW
jgi:hypothetical protein